MNQRFLEMICGQVASRFPPVLAACTVENGQSRELFQCPQAKYFSAERE